MTHDNSRKSVKNLTLKENKINKLTLETKHKQNRTREAFSLLELLVVIAILGMLASFVVPAVIDSKDKAQRSLTCTQLADIGKTLENFYADQGTYPETEEGLQALTSNPDSDKYPQYPRKPYYKKLPKDTWKTPITYIKKGNSFELISYASDRKEGGEDVAEDIVYPGCDDKK